MNKLKRLICCALLFGIQTLYFPLNKYLQGGVEFKTPLDDYIPLLPGWVVPYTLACLWWPIAQIWAAWCMEERLYEGFFLASAVMYISGLTIFAFFPTYIVRPELPKTGDWIIQLLNLFYTHDDVYNAFPSGHVYVTTLIALFWSRWFPNLRWLWVSTVAVIFLATLFTGQHYLPDPIGGLALAWFAYRIGLSCTAELKPNSVLTMESSEQLSLPATHHRSRVSE